MVFLWFDNSKTYHPMLTNWGTTGCDFPGPSPGPWLQVRLLARFAERDQQKKTFLVPR